MRFRKDKSGGDGAGGDAPAEAIAAPPPTPADRVDEPTAVQQADPPKPHGDPLAAAETPPSGNEVPAEAKPSGDAPQSPAEPAKVLADPQSAAPPPDAGARVEAAPPDSSARVDEPTPAKVLADPQSAAPPPDSSARVEAAPPPAGARVDAAPPPAGARVDAPPPQPGQLVAAAPAAAATKCPNCGSPAEQGQEMCIVCGSRIATIPPATTGTSRGWRMPAAIAGLAVLLIGVAVAFAVVELTRDDDVKKDDVADLAPTTSTAPPAGPPPTTPPPASTPPTTPEPIPTTPETTPEDPATPPDQPGSPQTSGPAEWPDGTTAFTVVLVSATSRNAADSKAEQAIQRGIDAGVLRSDDFSTLRPGFWVVFAGQFDTSEEATRAADRYAEQGFGGGYPREVKPK